MTHTSALLGIVENQLSQDPALLEFMVARNGLERVKRVYLEDVQAIAKAQADRVARRGRAFATGRDYRWPSKREQNGWPI